MLCSNSQRMKEQSSIKNSENVDFLFYSKQYYEIRKWTIQIQDVPILLSRHPVLCFDDNI